MLDRAVPDWRTASTGLNAGADYYLTKPFDTRELLACVNALLRRQGAQVDRAGHGKHIPGPGHLPPCSAGTDSIRLSAREFDVMRLLLQVQRAAIISKEVLLAAGVGI